MTSSARVPLPTPAQLSDLEATFGLFNIRLVDGNCISIRDTVAGPVQRPVLVALHGIGSGAASWLEVARIFNLKHRLLAWDAPGYGDSTPLKQQAPVASDYAVPLLRLLQSLAVDDFVLVGHSLGALVAAALTAWQVPGFVPRALVLVSPALGYGGVGRQTRGQQVRAQRLAGIEDPGIATTAALRHDKLLSSEASEVVRAWVHWNMARLKPLGYRQAIELLCGDDLLAYCRAIQAERERAGSLLHGLSVHVWCGSEDNITPPADCQQVADVFGVSLELIGDSAHACYVEQPVAVAQRLEQVLQTLQGPLSSSKGT
ncbi:alpha/beta hydrolase [Vandammella animalimorsus]|uniref:Alpha/beta hydrolase n=1 Tax=Vandammella animalimorsus TaxID=2029117 RepID=A0A2A2T570_9BURK|nr:alpha/beta hydrolase [Vandammella animalimorsus]PAX16643.1 alpha/beta hydrolase [Vandammella animalimorsus]PAX19273.1 alpha/beta hydrolase [Vandammella animalimorsus]